MIVDVSGRGIDLGDRPTSLMLQRWTGQLSPEPETVAWVESLSPGKVFFDIGASVGVHAIRAAVRGMHVTAFEPHEASYLALTYTVKHNDLAVICSNLALADQPGLGYLDRGRSKYTFYFGRYRDTGQPAQADTLDGYVNRTGTQPPDYIKMDVDGNEEAIIAGGTSTFSGAKSVLIEVDPVVNPDIPYLMRQLGFKFDLKQVNSCMITEGKYAGTANYIFTKE